MFEKAAPPPPDCLMLLFSSLKNLLQNLLHISTDILVKESRRSFNRDPVKEILRTIFYPSQRELAEDWN